MIFSSYSCHSLEHPHLSCISPQLGNMFAPMHLMLSDMDFSLLPEHCQNAYKKSAFASSNVEAKLNYMCSDEMLAWRKG